MKPFDIKAIPFSFPGIPGVRCLFSTRAAGDMTPAAVGEREGCPENRSRVMAAAGFAQWAELCQVHGDGLVAAVGNVSPEAAGFVEADGQYTFSRATGLVIRTADCQPLFFARDDGKAVAALHVGWRGNAANFPGSAVKRLCALFSCSPASLAAVRGPSLGPAAAEFVNFSREWPQEFRPWFDPERRTVNLWNLTRCQLEAAGMLPERVYSIDLCTRDMAGTFFSHRRGDVERHANIVWIE